MYAHMVHMHTHIAYHARGREGSGPPDRLLRVLEAAARGRPPDAGDAHVLGIMYYALCIMYY